MEKDSDNTTKAAIFFQHAGEIAATGNFDYAVDLYLEGLRRDPDAVKEGHIPLRELALTRWAKNSHGPSLAERMRRFRGRTPLEQMLNAEYLFSKDPENMHYAETMLKAAAAGGYANTAQWIADLIFAANNASKRPSLNTYLLLKDYYTTADRLDRALAACQHAFHLKPEDNALADDFKNLSAELAVSSGKYDQAGDFRQSIKDRRTQELLQSQQSVVKTHDYRQDAVEQARKLLTEDPDKAENIIAIADALADMAEDKAEEEAIDMLETAYASKRNFAFKDRAGRVRIRQLKRHLDLARAKFKELPDDTAVSRRVGDLEAELGRFEIEHYRLCTENYPTDHQARYEYGCRLFEAGRYDEAIPLFQETQKDPRHRIAAMEKVGMCFFHKGWFADAADIFTEVIDAYPLGDDPVAKRLRYNLGRALEEQGQGDKALEIYRRIARMDYTFGDVKERVNRLRADSGQETER